MTDTDAILCGDHVEVLRDYPENVFDMFLTSPPYDDLRDYNGYDFKFEPLAHELYRTLKPGGVGVWIVGDATVDGSETLTSFKQALYFKEQGGFKIHDTMIYQRQSRYPSFIRYYSCFEYMFILSKGTPQTTNLLQDKKNTEAGKRISGTERGKDGSMAKMSGAKKNREYKRFGVRENIWNYFTGFGLSTKDTSAFNHPAIFPEKLAEDHILSWSNPGDLILDPMCGSGTTCKMAVKHQRHYVGIDCSEEYCELSRERIDRFTQQITIWEER